NGKNIAITAAFLISDHIQGQPGKKPLSLDMTITPDLVASCMHAPIVLQKATDVSLSVSKLDLPLAPLMQEKKNLIPVLDSLDLDMKAELGSLDFISTKDKTHVVL